jgi:hypothetical protein
MAGQAILRPSLFDTAEDIDTGVDELGGKPFSFTVFPNPSQGQVQLKINSTQTTTVDINIRNVMGQHVHYAGTHHPSLVSAWLRHFIAKQRKAYSKPNAGDCFGLIRLNL